MPSGSGCGRPCRSVTGVVAGGGMRSTGTCRSTPPSCGRISTRQAAASTHRRPPPPRGGSPRTPGRNAVAKPARPPGGGGAGGEGLGRSRGGFTTKIHLIADGHCRPLSLIVTPGQRADCTQFKPVLEKIRVPRSGPGRPRKKPDSVAADKGIQQRTVPRVPATPGHPAHDPGEDRQPGRPPTQRLTRREATWLR